MVTIKSAAEQKFLTELILNLSYSNNVWIGAERQPDSATEFIWSDGSAFDLYSNWAIGRPSVDIRRTCVQMQSELSRQISDLEWADGGCTTGDWFICQKLQNWSFEYLQQAVLGARREIERNVNRFTEQIAKLTEQIIKLNEQKTELTAETARLTAETTNLVAQTTRLTGDTLNLNTELRNIQGNPGEFPDFLTLRSTNEYFPVPIGFVYVQLHGQPVPSTIWRAVSWREITSQYAGLFFRAVGGGSASFGNIQAENSPRLATVRTVDLTTQEFNIAITPGAPSRVSSGGEGWGLRHWALQFTLSSGEVRPRNTAMRIWIRE